MIRTRLVAATLVALSVLAGGCGNNGEAALPPASGLTTTASDGAVTVSWTDDTSVDYWLFLSTDPALTVSNFTTLGNVRIFRGVRSPYVVCGLQNGAVQYFTMNGRINGGPGGAGTPTVSAAPRAAGQTWTVGAAPAADFNAVGYAPITTCQTSSLPTGTFVAVGPNATIASSADGRTFTARAAPAGFTTDLNGVAAYTSSLNNPSSPGIKLVAVGAGGASLISTDGATWSAGAPFDAAAATLRAVAVYVGIFIAVGDGGTVVTSTDGVTWTARTSNTTANLLGIWCGSDRCAAVGDNGTIVRSVDGGTTWTVQPVNATPAFKRVAYGSFNNNFGSTPLLINTWVAVGDAGAVFFSTDSGTTWTATTVAGAGDFTGISYVTKFVAVDSAGNSFASFDGQTWTGPVATGATGLRGMIGNGAGYVTVGTGGATASAF
jgi:photosystem II stability/assembly factor-like uncharacterized protein